MKKIVLIIVALLLLQTVAFAAALDADEAEDDWRDAKDARMDAQDEHRDAKLAYAANQTPESRQAVIDTGKDVLNAALDEAEAWLIWKQLEARENPDVPEGILDDIEEDVEDNLEVIEGLRDEVDAVENEVELAGTFLKMIGKYFELLGDVARNVGKMWSHIMETKADEVSEFETELRDIAEDIDDNEDILEMLDDASDDIEDALEDVDDAETAYEEIEVPGTPFADFAAGNSHLWAARANLISALGKLNQAYVMIVRGG